MGSLFEDFSTKGELEASDRGEKPAISDESRYDSRYGELLSAFKRSKHGGGTKSAGEAVDENKGMMDARARKRPANKGRKGD